VVVGKDGIKFLETGKIKELFEGLDED